LYTEALNAANSTTPLELKRTILTNRAQTYLQYNDIHTALRDINLVLSSQYTLSSSPKLLTAKSYLRRAKLLCRFAKYGEARSDFDLFERICIELGVEVTAEEYYWSSKIYDGLQASEGSERRQKDDLLRAVDVRMFLR
jgi:hypothetical protein